MRKAALGLALAFAVCVPASNASAALATTSTHASKNAPAEATTSTHASKNAPAEANYLANYAELLVRSIPAPDGAEIELVVRDIPDIITPEGTMHVQGQVPYTNPSVIEIDSEFLASPETAHHPGLLASLIVHEAFHAVALMSPEPLPEALYLTEEDAAWAGGDPLAHLSPHMQAHEAAASCVDMLHPSGDPAPYLTGGCPEGYLAEVLAYLENITGADWAKWVENLPPAAPCAREAGYTNPVAEFIGSGPGGRLSFPAYTTC